MADDLSEILFYASILINFYCYRFILLHESDCCHVLWCMQKTFSFAVRDSLLNVGPLKDFSYGLRINADPNVTGSAKQSNYELVNLDFINWLFYSATNKLEHLVFACANYFELSLLFILIHLLWPPDQKFKFYFLFFDAQAFSFFFFFLNLVQVCCSGHGKNGSLSVLQQSIRPETITQVCMDSFSNLKILPFLYFPITIKE